jgi:phospholipid/cholesterol/gamma-HCH transport system permease protein
MVRSVAERAFVPARHVLEEFGDMMILTGKTIWSALRPPYPYGGEFVSQFLFALRLCWFPLLVSTVCICYAAPGLQAANFLTIFGALDRLGGFFVLGAVREIGPSVTAIVVAGVAGTRSRPISARARSARSSMPCRCSASTRSRTSSSPASWP